MAQASVPLPLTRNSAPIPYPGGNEASSSGVSWAAVAGGSFVTAALILSLSVLGAGMGLSSVSPWSNSGISTSVVGMGSLLWLAVIEIIACAIGGYVAGRLRTKWVDVHSDEVYFRDTAHGLLVWAVAFVITAALLIFAGTSVAAERQNATAARSEVLATDANRYFVDSLFRSGQNSSTPDEAMRSEIGVILAHDLREREFNADDKNYVAEAVAAKTGITRAEAEKRVTDVFARDQQAIDNARKAAAHALYWTFLALLLGAFAASLAATFGGRQRDHVRV
jgi:hypothetical protein